MSRHSKRGAHVARNTPEVPDKSAESPPAWCGTQPHGACSFKGVRKPNGFRMGALEFCATPRAFKGTARAAEENHDTNEDGGLYVAGYKAVPHRSNMRS
jgi:hypothetical protein